MPGEKRHLNGNDMSDLMVDACPEKVVYFSHNALLIMHH